MRDVSAPPRLGRERINLHKVFARTHQHRPRWALASWPMQDRTVDPRDLTPSQPYVWTEAVRAATKARIYAKRPAWLFDIDGLLVIGDGHTRLTAALLAGVQAVKVCVRVCRRSEVTNWTTW